MTEINPLSHDVVEVVVSMQSVLDYRPGQYVRLKFAGFPAREYSPTFRMDGTSRDDQMVFHVRCLPDGRVSSEIGRAISPGHRVHAQGPFGNAYLRQSAGPLVLVSGGTGWAPIWSLARAARQHQRDRKMIVIAGAPDPQGLYMRPALDWLRRRRRRGRDRDQRNQRAMAECPRPADRLSAARRPRGYRLCGRAGGACRCGQAQGKTRRGALLRRSVPAVEPGRLGHRPGAGPVPRQRRNRARPSPTCAATCSRVRDLAPDLSAGPVRFQGAR